MESFPDLWQRAPRFRDSETYCSGLKSFGMLCFVESCIVTGIRKIATLSSKWSGSARTILV